MRSLERRARQPQLASCNILARHPNDALSYQKRTPSLPLRAHPLARVRTRTVALPIDQSNGRPPGHADQVPKEPGQEAHAGRGRGSETTSAPRGGGGLAGEDLE